MSACNRYVLTKKTKKILDTRGIRLFCKKCEGLIQVGEEVESRNSRSGVGHIKLYHALCYDGCFIETED